MNKLIDVVYTFYIYVYFSAYKCKEVTLMSIPDTVTYTHILDEVQAKLNGYLADVRRMNPHIINSDIKGEVTIILRNDD